MPERHSEQSKRYWLDRGRFSAGADAPSANRPSSSSALDHYNLNEASRIRRMVIDHKGPLMCPSCGCPLTGLEGGTGDRAVLLLGCSGCGRGLVLPKS